MASDAKAPFDLGRLDDMLRDLADETHVRGELAARARIRRYVSDALDAAALRTGTLEREVQRAVMLLEEAWAVGRIAWLAPQQLFTKMAVDEVLLRLRAALAPAAGEGAGDDRE